jgi:type I restriction enzyme S subunit
MVPSDWDHVPLGAIIADLRAGVSVLSEDRSAENGERGVLKVSCISGGAFIPTENKRLLPGEEHRVTYAAEQGDVLISRANTYDLVAASCYVENSYPNLFLSDKHWKVVLRNEHRDSARWLAYALNLPALRRAFLAHATGTSGSMKNISKQSFLRIEIPRPPMEEQVAIVRILAQQDTLKNYVAKLILRKRKFKAAIMQEFLGGNGGSGRFRNLERQEVALGDVFSERNEKNRSDLPLLSITADRGIVPRHEVERKDSSSDDKRSYKRIAPGDIG